MAQEKGQGGGTSRPQREVERVHLLLGKRERIWLVKRNGGKMLGWGPGKKTKGNSCKSGGGAHGSIGGG